jgi:hypothetical protein
MAFFDTSDGPIVIEIPPAEGGSLNGNVVTAWQMPLQDLGLLGTDRGAGGRFAVLPPGYTGSVPDGITPVQSDTIGGYALIRVNLPSHEAADVAKASAYGKRVKVYPLTQADNPPETVFTDAQDVLFDSTIRYDASFFEHLNRVVQEESWIDRDRAMIDQLKYTDQACRVMAATRCGALPRRRSCWSRSTASTGWLPTTTARSTCGSARRSPPMRPNRTGSRPWQDATSSSRCASMAQASSSSTRPGSRTTSLG